MASVTGGLVKEKFQEITSSQGLPVVETLPNELFGTVSLCWKKTVLEKTGPGPTKRSSARGFILSLFNLQTSAAFDQSKPAS
jgi:hypothetical protein